MPEPDSLRDYTLSSSVVSGVGRADVQPAGQRHDLRRPGGIPTGQPRRESTNFRFGIAPRRDDAGRCWQYRTERATVQWGGIVFHLIFLIPPNLSASKLPSR